MKITARAGAIAGAAVVAVVLAVGFATATSDIPGTPKATASTVGVKHEPSPLMQARTDCSPDSGSMGSLTQDHDGQVTLDISGVGVDDTGYDEPQAEIDAVFCMLDKVGAPAAMTARVQDTRALDGMQDASWNGYSATWTYHPDDGLNIIITEG